MSTCVVGLAGLVFGCATDPDSTCAGVEAFPLDVDNRCFSSKVTLSDVCLRETQPETTTGTGSPACLVGPEGNVYFVENYGYTQILDGRGWAGYDLARFHVDDPMPPSCVLGEDLLRAASERCYAQNDDELCDSGPGFTPAMEAEVESSCGASVQDGGAQQ